MLSKRSSVFNQTLERKSADFSVLTCELNHRYEWVVEICVQVVCAKSTERPKIRTCFQSSPALVSCNAPRIGIETRTSGDVGTFRHMIIVACVP